jgi:hypothetical protein
LLEYNMLVLEAQCQSYLSAAIVPMLASEVQASAAGELEAKQNEREPLPQAGLLDAGCVNVRAA